MKQFCLWIELLKSLVVLQIREKPYFNERDGMLKKENIKEYENYETARVCRIRRFRCPPGRR